MSIEASSVGTSSKGIRLFGTDAPSPAWRRLRAGDLTAELVDGNLRTIRFRGREVLRAVAYVVRDRDWGTYAPEISDLRIDEGDGGFEVSYRAACVGPGASLTYRAMISGSDAKLSFTVEATPEADFETNRCGFCVLHPIDGVAGAALAVEHTDGRVEQTVFPALIEPWQPFKDIRALTHRIADGTLVTCRMEGDVFEMEDQRNWSDASFKTYVRPLARPWPYTLPAGQTSRQSVALELAAAASGSPPAPATATGGTIAIEIGEPLERSRHPDIALIVTPEETAATLAHRELLGEVGPQALICHFDPTAGHGAETMAGFARLQQASPARLLLECVVAAQRDLLDELRGTAELARQAGVSFSAIAVSPSVDRQSTPPGSAWPPCPPLEDIYAAARTAFPGAPLGGGMFSYFTELNRKRPPVALLDFVTHCTNPIVHAADDVSVMETLQALPHIFRSARAILGPEKPYHLGPSTIGMRQNPYGSRTMPNPEGERIAMAERDPRHSALFGAAWTVGYAARAAEARLSLLCVSALTGPFGLLREAATSDAALASRERYPLFAVVRGLCRLAGQTRLPTQSGSEGEVLALGGVAGSEAATLWLANLTAQPVRISLPSKWHDAGEALLLDEADPLGRQIAWQGSKPFQLGAYGVLNLRCPA